MRKNPLQFAYQQHKDNKLKSIFYVFLILPFIASCATKQNGFSVFEYRGSGGGDTNLSDWTYVNSMPESSMEIRTLLSAAGKNDEQIFAVESWFINNQSDVMVCRTSQAPKDSCTGSWWAFSKRGQEWKLIEHSAWVCFADIRRK